MNAKERMQAFLKGEKTDKIPNFPLIMTFAPKYIGRSLREYYLDYRSLVESNIRVAQDFGIDFLQLISDPYREFCSFGGVVEFSEDALPACKQIVLQDLSGISKLKPLVPYDCERMLDRIKGAQLYKQEMGDAYPILGWVEGAFAEAADLRNLQNLMFDLYDEPDAVHELLEICLQTAVSFAEAQIEAGADIIGIGDAAASLIGTHLYNEFAFNYEKRLVEAIHQAGALAKLHICGNITPLLESLKNTGADIVDIDWMVDCCEAQNKLGDSIHICGNIDPVSVIMDGSPKIIMKEVEHLKNIVKTGFIAPGCEVPQDTPHTNLIALNNALYEVSGR